MSLWPLNESRRGPEGEGFSPSGFRLVTKEGVFTPNFPYLRMGHFSPLVDITMEWVFTLSFPIYEWLRPFTKDGAMDL